MLKKVSNSLTIPTCIAIIKEIEESYPTLTTSELIDNLISVGCVDGDLSQVIFGSSDGVTFSAKGNLTQIDIDSLTSTITQQTFDNDGFYEVGISVDPATGRKVALGHVISGISAALYNPHRAENCPIDSQSIDLLKGAKFSIPVLNIDGVLAPPNDSPTTFELFPRTIAMDSLYAMTIAKDIAQTIIGNEYLWITDVYPVEIGGIGTKASSAQLYGNIDGFLIGTWLRSDEGQYICESMKLAMSDPNNITLSTILGEYYRTIVGENKILNMTTGFGTDAVSNLRFSNFLEMFKSTDFRLNSLVQSIIYQLVDFKYYEVGQYSFEDTIKSYFAFEVWCVSEFYKLRDASMYSESTGRCLSDCIDELGYLTYLDLSNYFISQSDPIDPFIDDFITFYPKTMSNRNIGSYI